MVGDVPPHHSDDERDDLAALDFSITEGEQVEFEITKGEDGRSKAANVTGPLGEYVQGVPRDAPSQQRSSFGGGQQRYNSRDADSDAW